MKRLALLALCGLLPLSAQDFEAGIFVGRQQFRNDSASDAYGDLVRLQPSGWTSASGLRLGWNCLELGPGSLQVNGAWQPKVTTSVTQSGSILNQGSLVAQGNLSVSSASLGAMFNVKFLVDAGIGLDYRFEQYEYLGATTNQGRPWARAFLGYALPLPEVKPFLGVEVDYALETYSLGFPPAAGDLARAMAPRMQVGLYGGVRF
jgi:hypothetical protein